MTLKGQGRKTKMFVDHYLENKGWRYRLGYNRTPRGNDTAVSNGTMTSRAVLDRAHDRDLSYSSPGDHSRSLKFLIAIIY